MRVLLFAGSLRNESLNKKLIKVAQALIEQDQKHQVESIDLKGLSIPVYDGDIETQGIPQGVLELAEKIASADAVIIASPEYNGTIAGPLKNTIDWLSRVRPTPITNKCILLMGASPGYFGAIRGLQHTRSAFDTLSAFVYPQNFALPKAHEAFAASGNTLLESQNEQKLKSLIEGFLNYSQKMVQN